MNENSDKIPEQNIGTVEHFSDKMSRRLLKKYEDILQAYISEGRLMTRDVFKTVLQQIPGYFEKGYTEQLNKLHSEYEKDITLKELALDSAGELADKKIIKYSLFEFLRNEINKFDIYQQQKEKQHEEDPHAIKLLGNIPQHIENFSRSMKNKLKEYIETMMITENKPDSKNISATNKINVKDLSITENIIDKLKETPTYTKNISQEVKHKYEDLLVEYLNDKNQRNINYFLILHGQILKDLQYIKDASTHTYNYKEN